MDGDTDDGAAAERLLLSDAAAELPILKALLRISEAVVRADTFDEVLEVVAEQALIALQASSLSISRWEQDEEALRTLINVGDLAPHEERWPTDEYYPVASFPLVGDLLRRGRSYTNTIDDPDCPPDSLALLKEVGKECEIAVPVMCGDTMWGEIWVTGVGGRRFDRGDVQLLQAIAAHIAVAIGRSELLSTVWGYAMQDALTGIANRRAIEQRFTETDWEATSPVILLCDLDEFKKINDRDGHPAGDQLLRDVAAVLGRLAGEIDGAVAARLGGDEFCVLLPDATLAAAQVFATDATRVLHETVDQSVSVCWGAAAATAEVRTGNDLLAAADAALLHAKRQGPARYSAGGPIPVAPPGLDDLDRRSDDRRAADRLAAAVVRALDERPDMALPAALEFLAGTVAQAVDAAAWAISECAEGGDALRLVSNVASVRKRDAGLTVLVEFGPPLYDMDDYPASARAVAEGSTFLAAVDLEGSDPDEVALLVHLGYQAVLGVGVPDGARGYLLEFYSHDDHQALAGIAPLAQVLASYCVSRLSGSRPSPRRP